MLAFRVPHALPVLGLMLQKYHHIFRQIASFLVAMLLCWAYQGPASSAQTLQPLPDQGVLEEVHFDAARQLLIAKGWSASGRSHAFPTLASIYLNDRLIYKGRLNALSYPRPDVAQAMGNPNWANTGFHIRAPLDPDFPSGTYTVRMEVTTTDGHLFQLSVQDRAREVSLSFPARSSHISRALAILAMSLPALCLLLSLSKLQTRLHIGLRTFGVSLLVSFFLLVAGGWTGSSITLLFQDDELVTHDEKTWLGSNQVIRSDEWHVITAMAVSQFNAAPQQQLFKVFENTSTSFSSAGHNMNTVGMTGVPVSNLSAIAKPATWGFFVLDLRRALAWYWWLPYFAGFAACLWILVRIIGLRWQASAILALSVTASPMSVGWSGWPAYIVFFALLAFGMTLTAWIQQSLRQTIVRGLVAGWALTGFVLTLYPAWLVVVASLLAPMALAWLYMQRANWRWSHRQALLLAAIAVVPLLLLSVWWQHTADAVSAIAATVYPGKRMEAGGYMDPWYLARGLFGPDQMFHITDMLVPSDAGSYIFLLIPLTLLLAWQHGKSRQSQPRSIRQPDLMAVCCLAFTIWVLYFSYVGLAPALAKITQWFRVPVYRTDIGLLLAQTFLLAIALRHLWPAAQAGQAHQTVSEERSDMRLRMLALSGAAGCAWLAIFSFSRLPASIAETITPGVALITVAAYAILAFLLVQQRFIAALAIYGVWTLGAALPFNPLLQAPGHIGPGQTLRQLQDSIPGSDSSPSRWAVLDSHRQSTALAASGLRISGGIFYHPPLSLWDRLDPEKKYFGIYNRYQHLTIEGAQLDGADFEPTLHSLDHVLLRVDIRRFDFRKIAATHVAAPRKHEQGLNQNPYLRHLKSEGSWSFYQSVR